MLPSLEKHRRLHSVAVAVVIAGISFVLTGLFLLYAGEPGLYESILFIAAVCGGLCYAAGRDTASYWLYSTLTPKFFLPEDAETASVEDLVAITKAVTARTRLLINSVVLVVLLVLAFLLAEWATEIPRAVLSGVITVVLFPLLLARGLYRAVPFFVAVAAMVGHPSGAGAIRQRSLRNLLLEDTVIAVAINLAVILPLTRREVFVSSPGYTDPTFFLSCLSLMLVVTFFMLSGARRSRVQAAAGEVISGQILLNEEDQGGGAPRSSLYRMGQSLGVVALWLFLAALLFQYLDIHAGFLLFYLMLLVPVVVLYLRERQLTLLSDLQQSRLMLEHIRASGQRPDLVKDL